MRNDSYRSLNSFFSNKPVASDTNGNAQEIHSHSNSNLVSDSDTDDIQSGPGSHLLVIAVDSSDENNDNPNFTTHSNGYPHAHHPKLCQHPKLLTSR